MPIRGVIPHNLLMPINQLEGIAQDIPRTIALMPTVDARRLREHRLPAAGRRAARRSDDRADGAGACGRPDAAEDHDARRAGPGARRRSSDDPLKSPMLERVQRRGRRRSPRTDRADLTARATAAYRDRRRAGVHQAARFPRHAVSPGVPRERSRRARCRTARRCTRTT